MDEIRLAWQRAWSKPDRRQIYEWGRSDLNIQGDYRDKGPFHVETSRYLILPFELLANDAVRMLNILKAIQTGGSLIADVFFQWVLANQPAAMMMTYQTDDDGEQHYLTRIEPTLKATECNRQYWEALKKKRDLYQFPPMNVYFQGANMNSLQRKSVRYEVNDEVWDWSPGMLGEAWGRTEAYAQICKILNISQGGEEGTDWDYCWNGGRRYEWGVHCLKCGAHQPLSFFASMLDASGKPIRDERGDPIRAGVLWDTVLLRDGRHDIDRCARSARFRCCRCGHEHADEPVTWERFNMNGAYILQDPDRGFKNCSVHWSSMVNGRYETLVAEFLKATEIKEQGSVEPLRKFYMKKLAQFWALNMAQEKITLRTAGFLKEPATAKGYKLPPELIASHPWRFIVADFQEGRGNDTRHFKVVARAWRDDGSSRLLWEGRLNSPEKIYELQLALQVRPACVCVDGAHEMNHIAGVCAKYGWTVLIGDDADTFPHKPKKKGEKPIQRPFSPRFKIDPMRGKAGAGRTYAFAFYWSNPSVKSITWNLRHGSGARWELPQDVSPTYRDEIDSEVRKREIDKKTGRPRYRWIQTKQDNHAWDCENMQTVCALIAELIPFDLEPEEEEKPAEPEAPKKLEPPSAPHDQPEQLALLS